MVFSSLVFLFQFLPMALFTYYVLPNRFKNAVLFVASLVFYAWGEPIYIVLLLFSTIFDYINGLLIDYYRDHKWVARAVFIGSIFGNVSILCFFKYIGFIIENIEALLGIHIQGFDLPLPIGLSFYTFQTMAYIFDIYFKRVKPERNIIAFGTYVTMFPQLVAGPIVKYVEISKQLTSRTITLDKFGDGAALFIRGMAKKVLIANNIGLLWIDVKSMPLEQLTVVSAWLGISAFTLQIYFDFSGYSDMARGLGKMFGFELPKNFNYPYMSKSVTEFWRRWHITLGSWFREYVYIPLGGNRHGLRKQLHNLLIVWFLTGLWHGASWNFIFWGLYFGLIVTIEKFIRLDRLAKCPKWIGHVYTLLVVMVGWVLFEYEHIPSACLFIGTMFGFDTHVWADNQTLYNLFTYDSLFILAVVCATPLPQKLMEFLQVRWRCVGTVVMSILYEIGLVLVTAYLIYESYNPFLYFRF